MKKATNNNGNPVKCIICGDDKLEDYKIHFPANSNAFSSVYIGWCKKHIIEGENYYNKVEGRATNINLCGSNS